MDQSRRLARESSELHRFWDLVARKLAQNPYVVVSFKVPDETRVPALSDALAREGFETPLVTNGRRWFRRSVTLEAAKRAPTPLSEVGVIAILSNAVEIGSANDVPFGGWGAVALWPPSP